MQYNVFKMITNSIPAPKNQARKTSTRSNMFVKFLVFGDAECTIRMRREEKKYVGI